jgi:hypothetical protein
MKRFAILLAALVAGSAFAAPAFDEVDADKSGGVSAEEAKAVEGLDFAAADKNADGNLDAEEYAAATAG